MWHNCCFLWQEYSFPWKSPNWVVYQLRTINFRTLLKMCWLLGFKQHQYQVRSIGKKYILVLTKERKCWEFRSLLAGIVDYVNFSYSALLRMGFRQGIRAGGGEGCRQTLPAHPAEESDSGPQNFGFFFYFCVVHFENMNGNPAATGRLKCGIMNISVCKLMLGFFLPEPMNSGFSNLVSISLKSF